MAYYYFAATLPRITFDGPNAINLERFSELCKGQLADSDMDAVTAVREGTEAAVCHPALAEWVRQDNKLKFSIAKIRAARLKRDFTEIARESNEHDPELDKEVVEAYARHNPADRERVFDRLRWGYCEDIARFDSFAAEFIITYAIRLRIADRWAVMSTAKGAETLQKALTSQDSSSNMTF